MYKSANTYILYYLIVWQYTKRCGVYAYGDNPYTTKLEHNHCPTLHDIHIKKLVKDVKDIGMKNTLKFVFINHISVLYIYILYILFHIFYNT